MTLYTHCHERILGSLVDRRVQLSVAGAVALAAWLKLPQQFPSVVLRECMVLPNQLLAILAFAPAPLEIGARAEGVRFAPDGSLILPRLSDVLRAFQSSSTTEINWALRRREQTVWQRNHYEKTIRSRRELDRVRNLLLQNQRPTRYGSPPDVKASVTVGPAI